MLMAMLSTYRDQVTAFTCIKKTVFVALSEHMRIFQNVPISRTTGTMSILQPLRTVLYFGRIALV